MIGVNWAVFLNSEKNFKIMLNMIVLLSGIENGSDPTGSPSCASSTGEKLWSRYLSLSNK